MQQSIAIHELPQTFQDAISVTRHFGLEYIWIDSLCIIQDDQIDWRYESRLMTSVYGGSSLVIAASHAKDGSKGCFVNRNPKSVVPCFVTLSGEQYRCVPASVYSRGVNDTALSQRAWAFQERFLAPRTLLFGASQIFWECQEKKACETFPGGLPSSVQFDRSVFVHDDGRMGHSIMDDAQSNPSAWSDIVLAYSAGRLTRESDKLPAISGVARWMHQFSGDEYLAGLWRDDLEWQLLWSVNSTSNTNRHSSGSVSESSLYRAPSWSWASRNGIIRQQFPLLTQRGTSNYDLLVKVLSASIVPDTEGDPFGQVTNGFIRLSCHGLLRLKSACGGSAAAAKDVELSIQYGNKGNERNNKASLLWDDDNNSWQTFDDAWLLPVWTINPAKPDSTRLPGIRWGGLLLRKQGKSCYRRVGRADMYADMESDAYLDEDYESLGFTPDQQSSKSRLESSFRKHSFDVAAFIMDPNVDYAGFKIDSLESIIDKYSGLCQTIITLV